MGAAALADNAVGLWAVMIVTAAAASFLERATKLGGAISAPLIAMGTGCALAMAGVLPTPADFPAYDVVWTTIMPVASALLVIETRDMSK